MWMKFINGEPCVNHLSWGIHGAPLQATIVFRQKNSEGQVRLIAGAEEPQDHWLGITLQFLGLLELERYLGWLFHHQGCVTLASPDLVRIRWLLHQLPRVLEAVARYHFRRCRLLQSPYRPDTVSMATASRSLHDPWEPLKASCCYDLLALHHDWWLPSKVW